MRYLVHTRDRIFVKSYSFWSVVKNMGKNIGKNISKTLSGKNSPGMLAMRQKLLDHPKKSATVAFKAASKRAIQKIAEAAGDLSAYKIANKIRGVQKIHNKIIQKQLQM